MQRSRSVAMQIKDLSKIIETAGEEADLDILKEAPERLQAHAKGRMSQTARRMAAENALAEARAKLGRATRHLEQAKQQFEAAQEAVQEADKEMRTVEDIDAQSSVGSVSGSSSAPTSFSQKDASDMMKLLRDMATHAVVSQGKAVLDQAPFYETLRQLATKVDPTIPNHAEKRSSGPHSQGGDQGGLGRGQVGGTSAGQCLTHQATSGLRRPGQVQAYPRQEVGRGRQDLGLNIGGVDGTGSN